MQPEGSVYIIEGAPGEKPVTTPVVDPTLAIAGVLLVHVPPLVVLLNVIVEPVHTLLAPVMAAGEGLTDEVLDAAEVPVQPKPSV